MIRDILPLNDKALKTPCEKFDFANPQVDPLQLYKDLAETMANARGLGLSANQIGEPYRAFVMTGEHIYGVFNPIIVDVSDEQVVLEEGCLSEKNFFVKIKRPKKIKVRFAEPNGAVTTQVFDGMTARVFQHELDHLNGVNIKKRANAYHLAQANKRMKKLNETRRHI